jgi:hypothetical protein
MIKSLVAAFCLTFTLMFIAGTNTSSAGVESTAPQPALG